MFYYYNILQRELELQCAVAAPQRQKALSSRSDTSCSTTAKPTQKILLCEGFWGVLQYSCIGLGGVDYSIRATEPSLRSTFPATGGGGWRGAVAGGGG